MDGGERLELQQRFLLNLPEREWKSWNRLWYHIELAHYFWQDNMLLSVTLEKEKEKEKDKDKDKDKAIGIETFCHSLLSNLLSSLPSETMLRELYQRYLHTYKYKIPVSGVILTVGSRVLLVKNRSSGKWGFPKGKRNREESEWQCAKRELEEETGICLSSDIKYQHVFRLDSATSRIVYKTTPKSAIRGSVVTLFYIALEETSKHGTEWTSQTMRAKCAKEISQCEWMAMNTIPSLEDGSSMLKAVFRHVHQRRPSVLSLSEKCATNPSLAHSSRTSEAL